MMRRIFLLIFVVIATACGNATDALDVDVAGTTLPELARASDVVVVGTVTGEAGTVATARDPRDMTRPHPAIESSAQLYRVHVEESLKGGPRQELIIAISRWSRTVGGSAQEDWPQFIAFQQGQRYALFMRLVTQPVGPYYAIEEPGRFKIGAQVSVESSWRKATQVFPTRNAADFMADLHA